MFFIHPTTYLASTVGNARYDEPGLTSRRIDRGVLRYQASVFNGCCRIYAPHYRQAALGTFMHAPDAAAQAAFELAYADVARAFDYYLEHASHGGPFIIASHSQGSLHALRLLAERIAHRPLKQRLIAAYVIGYPLPLDGEPIGIPVCREAQALHCLLTWNTVKGGAPDRSRQPLLWQQGSYRPVAPGPQVCVNPLSWTLGGTGSAALNLGSLPAGTSDALPSLVPHLTGAQCADGRLDVALPWSQRGGFTDLLTLFGGSYHVFDYNLFWLNLRVNARERVRALRAAAAIR